MNKFKYLVGYGLKKRVARKAFVISNIFVLILLIIIVNLPTIISVFSNGEEAEKILNVDVYNNSPQTEFTNDLGALLISGFGGYTEYILVEPTEAFDEDYFWKESEQDVAIIINGTIEEGLSINIYTDNNEIFTFLYMQIDYLVINYQIADYKAPTILPVNSPDYENPETGMILSSIMSMLILPIFMLIIMATQFVGVDIIEEKSTKAIETIISSVPAKTHFFSKIISSVLFVLIQGGLVLVYGAIAMLVGKVIGSSSGGMAAVTGTESFSLLEYVAELMPNWPVVLVIILMFTIVGTFLYLVIAALFASMAVTQEDYQQFQTPLMLILLASFYIALFGSMSQASTFMKVMSFIPFFSPMLAPIAFASGALSLIEVLISFIITVVTLYVLTKLFTPVYKVAILSYDQTKFFKRIKEYFKKGFQKPNNKKN